MYMAYCPNCKKETGHKRYLGFGTLFAVILTGGLWLIAILFYPTRCIACGGWRRGKPGDLNNQIVGYLSVLAIFLVIYLFYWLVSLLRSY
jgi:hypothetical protein